MFDKEKGHLTENLTKNDFEIHLDKKPDHGERDEYCKPYRNESGTVISLPHGMMVNETTTTVMNTTTTREGEQTESTTSDGQTPGNGAMPKLEGTFWTTILLMAGIVGKVL